ncbi:MAG: protein-L-isoaspartate(D-aspartate) O-methyltransferase [Phycisphaerales bacterium]|nr:protein-L-isoaspartate(D-aspartate) O-methyltransferase [Phycisphaerales bacterium]
MAARSCIVCARLGSMIVKCLLASFLFLPIISCRESGRTETAGRETSTGESGEAVRQTSVGSATAPPRTQERAEERFSMVRGQIKARGVKDQRVLDAMQNVPRHWFVPSAFQNSAYADRPLSIGHGQTISQPYIVALMTEQLSLQSGEKVLEIGTGSGYQAAVLTELTDQVYTIEIVETLAKHTIELLRKKGYHTIRARIGDGYRGWPEAAPFDAIIVTCAPDDVPKPLVEQLAVGGRMCIPVDTSGWAGQELILLEKQQDGLLKRTGIIPVRFVPMTGEAQDK